MGSSPPVHVTAPSALLIGRSRVSGLMRRTERPIQTRFRCAYAYRLKLARHTKSLTHYTKGTRSPSRAPTACKHSISGTISLPSSGFFSPFPHGTCSLSVSRGVLRLGGWSPHVQTGFHVSRPTLRPHHFTATGLSPAMARLSFRFALFQRHGLVPVRSPLLRESRLMSFPPGTEMFHFPGFALFTL